MTPLKCWQKVKCWPGCRAQIINGKNTGAIVVVIDRDSTWERLIGSPTWLVMPCQPIVSYSGNVVFCPGVIPDFALRPLPDICDEDIVTEQYKIKDPA